MKKTFFTNHLPLLIIILISSIFVVLFFVYKFEAKTDKDNVIWLQYNYEIRKGSIYVSFHDGSDGQDVYTKKIDGADPVSFKVLNQEYSKDKNSVYFATVNGVSRVEQADSESFILPEGFAEDQIARDANHAYYEGKIIEGVDLGTFQSLSEGYSKDKNFVYLNGKKIEGADTTNFVVLSWPYSKDKKNIYFFNQVLPNADSATFKVLCDRKAQDKNNFYLGDKVVNNIEPCNQ